MAFGLTLLALFYFVPTLVGNGRGMLHTRMLFTVNLLSGWTVIGWALCMLWSVYGQTVDGHLAILRDFPKPQSRTG